MADKKRDKLGRFLLAPIGDWQKMRALLNPTKFQAALKKNIRRATEINALIILKEIRKRVQEGGYSANAALTVLIKGSSKPLVGTGDDELFKAVTHEMVNDFSAFIGVLKSARGKSGEPMVDVAAVIHEGMTIKVTDKMRGLFIALADATRPPERKWDKDPATGRFTSRTATRKETPLTGRAKEIFDQIKGRGQVKPLKPSTTQIVIPPRPFIKSVFEDPKIQKRIQENWKKAIDSAIRKV